MIGKFHALPIKTVKKWVEALQPEINDNFTLALHSQSNQPERGILSLDGAGLVIALTPQGGNVEMVEDANGKNIPYTLKDLKGNKTLAHGADIKCASCHGEDFV